MFEPSLIGYLGYCLGFFARYFLAAGGVFCLFHFFWRARLAPYRIQPPFPPLRQVIYEIRWSILNTASSGLATIYIYHLIRSDRTSMYFTAGELGWPYFFLSILLCLIGYDTWIYWQHRWLHTPWLFRHVHSIHHRVSNPTAFAAFAQHPVETFMGNVYFILFVVLVPIHPYALALAGLYMFVIGILAHAGYELYPSGFTRHPLLGWINTSTHHNMHHRHVGCNYGNWFNYWDAWMGTNHPAYHDTFEATRTRVAATRCSTATSGEREGLARRRAQLVTDRSQ